MTAPDRGPPLSLAELEAAALPALGPAAAAYFLSGAGGEEGLADNLAAWRRRRLTPRALQGRRAGGGTGLTLFGRSYAHPFVTAPMALQKLAHPEGEVAAAMAAAAMEGAFCLSMETSAPPEAVAASGAPFWFQITPRHDRAQTEALLARAEAAGAGAVVVTVDAPFTPPRPRERRAGFALPPGVRPVLLDGLPGPAPSPPGEGESMVFHRALAIAPDWSDIAHIRARTGLPLILKGVLNPADALRGVEEGAQGIVVSNHGGRLLEALPPALDMLPGIAAALGGRATLLVDGGVRRGSDALIARAMGADAVMVGRPILHGLAWNGARGAAHALRLLRDELEVAMGLLGLRGLEEVGPEMLLEGGGARFGPGAG